MMFTPFTAAELRYILRAARADFDRVIAGVKYNNRCFKETGYAPVQVFIAQDLKEAARIRKLIAHTKSQLMEAIDREKF